MSAWVGYRVLLRAGYAKGNLTLSRKQCDDLLFLFENPGRKKRGNPHTREAKRQELIAARLLDMDLAGKTATDENVRAVAELERVHRSTVYAAKRKWAEKLRPSFARMSAPERKRYIASLEDEVPRRSR